jgi:protein-S-isoprenylcysteine O-methyltransferase Ste14
MVKYIIFAAVEIGVLVWVIEAIRSRVRHEITMSIGYFLFMALCFENFASLLPFQYWKLGSILSLRIIGFVLLGIGIVIALTAFFTMKILGKPKKGWEDTTQLIETGIFSLTRHPIYFAAFLGSTGVFLIKISIFSIILVCVSDVLFFLAAFYEDKWNEEKFGKAYKEYQKKTKLFIPFIY